MKRFWAILLVIGLALALAACGGDNGSSGGGQSGGNITNVSNNQENKQAGNEPPGQGGNEDGAESKVLVAYFSATGTTRALAEYAADALGADLYEIIPAEPYTAADLDYGDDNSRTSLEQNDPAARPAIGGAAVENMADYDIVFVGYPIWWGQAPRIISTFLESYDFAGKTIVPFCTSGSSPIGSSATNLHGLAEGAAWLDGERLSGSLSRDDMAAWLNGLGLAITAE